MKKIFIGEEKEYARRLTNYLLGHLPADIQLQTFTCPEILLREEEIADLYLLGVDYYEKILELEADFSERDIILIRKDKTEEGFSRLDPPYKLVRQICDFRESCNPLWRKNSESCQLIAVYAPSPDISLRRWIWREMEAGDLYLGLQDMGETEEALPSEKRDDMGSLCYYIHLHEEEISEKMRSMLRREEGKFYLDSPPWFFDFLGLQEEDYRWFFHTLKEDAGFSKIYVGLGNNAIPSLEYFSIFDHVILLDCPENKRIHRFCDRFVRTALEEGYLQESSIDVRGCTEAERNTGGWEKTFETGRPF